ncbi:MAG: DUF1028 domain-containing protein [Alphaproteobacteria bacterium]|nr:DUF1028 domain-containing protein [Alphaproteobacteria bacterium]
MTFSIAARCARTGAFGLSISTSNIAVGTRCPFAKAKVGAVLTQHRTDPRLGPRGVRLLESGCSAQETIAALVASTPHVGWRQLAAIDPQGRTASYGGGNIGSIHNEAHGKDCIAIGNIIANPEVPVAMARAFEANPELHIAERVMRALEAGIGAGGEVGPVRSAALYVVHEQDFPLVDLRVDAHDQPIAALRMLWEEYTPWMDEFVVRAVDPERARGGS